MRFHPIAAVLAVVLAGCAESATMPVQPEASRPSLLAGTPPPPPISGDGSADLEVGLSDAGIVGQAPTAPCNAFTSFAFTSSYFDNDPLNNQWVHIKADNATRNVSIHQTQDKIDARGTIVGPDFTFRITNTNGGNLSAGRFNVSVHGVVTFDAGGSCEADGNFSGFFSVGQPED